ncbi:hypothetical protein A2W14_03500 [Candidatus Gottesmanbacteria bacterium RBG_16_37_8]|uniref:AlgX/AlgJ SGNH hydrolase-like domain-containing protein n=1 Tax=Candidatus Gottesmanbacteria bacterium RBG_16_37_8 TaxID=1798371 RepID=A0A1F5YST7_9BACT|nr:MAG: hypothetical protein A2W14_03500 [Candidatus Gottesmanbacteria bacterium RBG_16_37_8]
MYNTWKMKKQQRKSKVGHRVVIILGSLFFMAMAGELITAKFLPQKTFRLAYSEAINCFKSDKTLLFTLKPNCTLQFENYDTGETVSAKTNNMGYRGEDFQPEKNANEKRILVEGDSFVLGFGVSDNDVFTKVLEEKLGGGTRVINAGYKGGFGPDGYYLHLKNEGMNLAPDLTIFSIFVYNDFTDMTDSDWLGSGKNGEPQRIVSNKIRVDEIGYLLPLSVPYVYRLPILRNSHLAILSFDGLKALQAKVKHYYDRIYFKIFKPQFPSGEASDSNFLGTYFSNCLFGEICHRKAFHLYQDMMSVIRASRDLTKSKAIDGNDNFLILIIPADFQIYDDVMDKYKTDTGIPYHPWEIEDPNPQRRLRELFDSEGIKYIDLLPLMRLSRERLYFKKDGHFNREGHAFSATVVYNWIREYYGNLSSR